MRHSLALILTLSLIACSSTPTDDLNGKPRPVADMYSDAIKAMQEHDYESASKKFESLLSRYPYGIYAQQAQMELAYAYFKQSDPDSALSAVDQFIKDYPTSPHMDYILYLKGVIHFNADMGLMGSVFPHDLSQHDPEHTQKSFDAFKELVTRFPDSKYTPDAKVRMQFLVNALARHDLNIAQYYLRRHAYVAALNRAQGILTDYPQASVRNDALQVMVQAYDAMGMTKLRDDTRRVLDLNSRNAPVPAPAPAPAPAVQGMPPAPASAPAATSQP